MKYFLKRSARPRKTGLLARKRKSCEFGPKVDFFDERLNASAAYFEIHENNRSVSDDEYNTQTPTHYAFKGTKAVTKGYELEMAGELAPGWQLQAGYTHKIVRGDQDAKISTYKLKANLDKLIVGGGVRWDF